MVIKHKVRNGKYLCNEAVYPSIKKISHFWKDVTCKNCLRFRKKELEILKKKNKIFRKCKVCGLNICVDRNCQYLIEEFICMLCKRKK
jgi:hypothetical protein